jgi:hypothetical protein
MKKGLHFLMQQLQTCTRCGGPRPMEPPRDSHNPANTVCPPCREVADARREADIRPKLRDRRE